MRLAVLGSRGWANKEPVRPSIVVAIASLLRNVVVSTGQSVHSWLILAWGVPYVESSAQALPRL